MKNLLFTIVLALMYTTSTQAQTWIASCGSKNWSKEFFKPNYNFTVRKGEVGGCDSDKTARHSWQFSERQEVKQVPEIYSSSKWEWSATVDIDRSCKPAERSTIVQVHDGAKHISTGPPSFLAVNYSNHFRGQGGPFVNGSSYDNGKRDNDYGDFKVPNKPFHVKMIVDWKAGKSVKTQYWIDGKFLGYEDWKDNGIERLFFKFGVYRINSNCDINQTYTGVILRKLK